MALPWKQQIRRELRRRDVLQLGNYGSLVESYVRLLEQEEDRSKWNKETEDHVDEPLTPNSYIMIQATSDCNQCHDLKHLKEQNDLLLKQLTWMEREREHLLTSMIEEKQKEAERVNQNNEIEERYRQLREILYRKRERPTQSRLVSISSHSNLNKTSPLNKLTK
ncbi:uncharacterized protein LOC108706859 [Xenopus laevis]|uniref:Uncharacterized protein n=2 Tax=Xenopus laevis TaxID=8355 RepID=A0A974DUR5_XENLA|nr:uncharacterized protein LOC108706859 [Xenopus laevis]OCT97601.1 hypothetical protein XELAEV_18009831mg [Xenopus laevis]